MLRMNNIEGVSDYITRV
jgi:transcriptional regulator with GAF, ATPase, and Fis domain